MKILVTGGAGFNYEIIVAKLMTNANINLTRVNNKI